MNKEIDAVFYQILRKIFTFKLAVVTHEDEMFFADVSYKFQRITLLAKITCSGSRVQIVRQIIAGILHKLKTRTLDDPDFVDPHTNTVVMSLLPETQILSRAKHFVIKPYFEKIKKHCYQMEALELFSWKLPVWIEKNDSHYSLRMLDEDKVATYYVRQASFSHMLEVCMTLNCLQASFNQDTRFEFEFTDKLLTCSDDDDFEDFGDSPVLFSEN